MDYKIDNQNNTTIKLLIINVFVILLVILLSITGVFAYKEAIASNDEAITGNILAQTFLKGENIGPILDYLKDGPSSIIKVDNTNETKIITEAVIDLDTISDNLKNDTFKYTLLTSTDKTFTNCSSVTTATYSDCTVEATGDFTKANTTNQFALASGIEVPANSTLYYKLIIYIDGTKENNHNLMNNSLLGTWQVYDITVYTITLDNQGATKPGTPLIYESFENKFYYDKKGSKMTSSENPIVIPEKTGYTFTGYYNSATGTTKYINKDGYIESSVNPSFNTNQTWYAKWTNKIYTITLDNQKAVTAGTGQIYLKYDDGYYLDQNATNQKMTTSNNNKITIPTKTNFTFEGYYTEKNEVPTSSCTGTKYIDANGKITSNASTTLTTNTTLYACWTNKVINITLNQNGATTTGTQHIYEKFNDGIYLDSAITNKMTTSSNPVTKPQLSYTITLNYNDGETSNGTTEYTKDFMGYYTEDTTNGIQLINANGNITNEFTNTYFTTNSTIIARWGTGNIELPTPTRTGYSFDGWYTEETGGTKVTATTEFTSNTTIYAHWTINELTINILENGAAATNTGYKISLSTTSDTYTGYKTIDSTGSSVKFSGVANGTYYIWAGKSSYNKTTRIYSGVQVTINNNSKSEIIRYYELTLTKGTGIDAVSNGGTNIESIMYLYNSTNPRNIAINATVKTGYTWDKWTKTNGTNLTNFTATEKQQNIQMGAGATTLRADAIANSYTIKFASTTACPLSTSYTDVSATYDTVINKANPSCTGYTFTGWTASGDFSTTQALHGTTNNPTTAWSNGSTKVTSTYFKNLSTTSGGTVTLTANWQAKNVNYTVNHYTRNINDGSYTLYSTETKTATAQSEVTLTNITKTISGFTYLAGYTTGNTTKPTSGAVTTTTIAADGSTVINLYYRRNYLYIQYDMNGGSLIDPHGEDYGSSGSIITNSTALDNTKFRRGAYEGKVGHLNDINNTLVAIKGIHDYNYSEDINIGNSGYIAENGAEWCLTASGTGTCYNQATTDYETIDMVTAARNAGAVISENDDLSTGDVTITLYVHWVANTVTVNIHENGAAATNTGYSIGLSTSSETDDSTSSLRKTSTTSSVDFSGIPNGTYFIWAGRSSQSKTTRIYSGESITVNYNTNPNKTINYYELTLTKGTGISAVSNGGTNIESIMYLYNSTNPRNIAINATVETGYIWNKWTKTSGTDLTTFTATEKSQNIQMGAGATTLRADATLSKYTVKFASTTTCPLNTTTYADINNISYGSNIKSSAIANPTCTGYTFTGWTASGDFSTAQAKYGTTNNPTTAWSNGNTKVKGTYFKNLSTTSGGTVTLTANWEANKVTVNIKKDGSDWSSTRVKVALYQGGSKVYPTGDDNIGLLQNNGTSVEFTAIPAGTYNVYASYNSGENGSNIMRDTGQTVTVTSSPTATLNYYTVTRTVGENTSLTTRYDNSSGSTFTATFAFLSGQKIYITASADAGYNLSLTVCGTARSSGYTQTITGTCEVKTTATLSKYNVKFASTTACPLNTTTYADINNISYGSNIKSSAIANPTCTGYTFTGWTASGDFSTAQAKYGTTNNPTTAWSNGNTKVKGTYFKNLSTTSGGTVTLTANWDDAPVATIVSAGNVLKKAKQTLSLKCTDDVGITNVYFGTKSSPSDTDFTTVTSTTTWTKTDQEVSAAGTYYLICKDTAGVTSNKPSKIYQAYTIYNVLNKGSGEEGVYNSTNYETKSNATYIALKDTPLTLASVYTIPKYSKSAEFQGYSTGEISSTTATLSTTAPTLSTNNSKYTMWFDLNRIYFRYKPNGGTITSPTQDGNNTYTWSTNNNGLIMRSTNGATAGIFYNSMRYGLTGTMDVFANYNNPNVLYITKEGYKAVSGAEWICDSGCKTANMTFNQGSHNVNYSTQICKDEDIDDSDCYVDLKVNWAPNVITVNIHENGAAATNTGYSIGLSTSSTTDDSTTALRKTSTTSSVEFNGLSNGTYYIWAGRSNTSKTTRIYSGVSITVDYNSNPSKTINYYELTLVAGTGISDVSNFGNSDDSVFYLRNSSSPRQITIDATVESGYTWSKWVKTSGTNLTTFTATTKNQQIQMGAGAATLEARATYTATPTITRSDFNTFTYTATGGKAYYVSTSSTAPAAGTGAASSTFALDTWTTKTSTGNLTLAAGTTYYVWAKDATTGGNVSANKATIAVRTVTRSVGTGTTLTTKYESSSGTAFTTSPNYVLNGTPIYATATANDGYRSATVTVSPGTLTDNVVTVTANTTITSSGTPNTVTINIKENGSAATNTGYRISLSTTSDSYTGYKSSDSEGSSVVFSGVKNGTYYLFAGKSSYNKTGRMYTGTSITVSDNNKSATVNYYELTLTEGTGISAVNNFGTGQDSVLYLAGRDDIHINATVKDGYTWNKWTKTSGTTPATITATTKEQDIKMGAGSVTLEARATYTATPTITRSDFNTFTYTATGGKAYYVSTSSTAPAAGTGAASSTFALDTWTTKTSTGNLTLAAGTTYYVWVKDATTGGNVSANKATIAVRTVTRSVGTGTTLTTKYGSSSGTAFTTSPNYVLNGTPIYATATANDGYRSATVTVSPGTLTDNVVTVTANTTITSSATPNTVTVNIHENGAAATNTGYKVSLSTANDSNTAYKTTNSTDSSVTFSGVENGTYYIWAGRSETSKNTVIYSGVSVTINNNDQSKTINYYKLTLTAGTGISDVSNFGNESDAILYLSTREIAINATVKDGYTWNKWVKTSGTNLATFTATEKSQTVKMGAGAATLEARATYTATPTITRSDYNTFTYTATEGKAYYVSTSSTAPAAGTGAASSTFALDTWTTKTSTGNLTLAAGTTYYVWVKDATTGGNVSANKATIAVRTVTRSVGTGTTLTTKYGSSSGTAFTTSPNYVLNGTPIYATATANDGYRSATVTVSPGTLTDNVVTVTANTTITSSATPNTVTVNIHENGAAATNTGYKVSLSTANDSNTAYKTTNSTDSSVTFSGVENGTYYIWAGRSETSKNTVIYSGVSVTINNNDQSKTINYYKLTLTAGTGISDVSNFGNESDAILYLSTREISINATVKDGYTWNKWVKTSGTNLTTFTATEKSQTVKMGAGAATLEARATYTATPTITRSDFNTFTYTATGGKAYYVSTSSTAPAAGTGAASSTFALDTWTTKTSTGNLTLAAGTTYYVWVKDATTGGNVSANKATIAVRTVTRSVGTGTTLTTKYGSSSGTAFTTSPNYVLNGTPIYATATANDGYRSATVTVSPGTLTDNVVTVTANTTITSSATPNTVTINIKENGSAATNTGYRISLSTTSDSYTGYKSSDSEGSSVVFSGVKNGTYYLFAGKSSYNKTGRMYTGTSITVSDNNKSATVNYYELTLTEGTGISAVNNFGTGQDSVLYLAGRDDIHINATVKDGYTWNKWTKTRGTTPATITATTKEQDIKMGAGSVTLEAGATANGVTITINKNGSAWANSGMKVSIRTASDGTTDLFSSTVTSGSTATFTTTSTKTIETGTTYYIFMGKDGNHTTTMVYSGVSFTGGTGVTKTINYYDLTVTRPNATSSVKLNGTVLSEGDNMPSVITAVAGGVEHTIVATPKSTYAFATWSKTSGTVTFGDAKEATTTVKVSAQSTIRAISARYSVHTSANSSKTYYNTLNGAADACTSDSSISCYIHVLGNVTDTTAATIDKTSKIYLFLDNYTLTMDNQDIAVKSTFRVYGANNTGTEGTGKIKNPKFIMTSGSYLSFWQGISITSTTNIVTGIGTANFYKSTLTSSGGDAVSVNGGTINVHQYATIQGSYYGIFILNNSGSTANINLCGGTVKASRSGNDDVSGIATTTGSTAISDISKVNINYYSGIIASGSGPGITVKEKTTLNIKPGTSVGNVSACSADYDDMTNTDKNNVIEGATHGIHLNATKSTASSQNAKVVIEGTADKKARIYGKTGGGILADMNSDVTLGTYTYVKTTANYSVLNASNSTNTIALGGDAKTSRYYHNGTASTAFSGNKTVTGTWDYSSSSDTWTWKGDIGSLTGSSTANYYSYRKS